MKHWQGLTAATEGTGISAPLSQQVNMLGELLGHAAREIVGEVSFGRNLVAGARLHEFFPSGE